MTGAWLALLGAGLLEIAWAMGLKATGGLTSRPWLCAITVVLMILSFVLLAVALKHLPVGTGYAVWTGIGTVGTVVFGIIVFGESAAPLRIACIVLVLAGIVGLKLTGK